MHSLGVKPQIQDCEIWPRETNRIVLWYVQNTFRETCSADIYTFGAGTLRELEDHTHFLAHITEGGGRKSFSEMADRTTPNFRMT